MAEQKFDDYNDGDMYGGSPGSNLAEQKQKFDDKSGSCRVVYMVRNPGNKKFWVLAITPDKKIITTQNFVITGYEGLRIEQSTDPNVVFITSNTDPNKVLACDDNGKLSITSNRVINGWEGWQLEHAKDDIYYIVSNKKGFVLAIDGNGVVQTTKNRVPNGWEGIKILSKFGQRAQVNQKKMGIFIRSNKWNKQLAIDDGKRVTSSGNRVWNGWEGFVLETSKVANVYFIVHNKHSDFVLACDDNGKIQVTGNRMANGWEGWVIENGGNGVKFIVSKKKGFVLAMNKDGVIRTTKNKVANGWEGWRFEIEQLNM